MIDIVISKTKEYLSMENGAPIDSPDELIFVENILIKSLMYKVYFKNKTLKHFIERRKQDYSKRHTAEETEIVIVSMIYDLYEALKNYSSIEDNPNRENSFLIYKDFENILKTPVTVVLEKLSSDIQKSDDNNVYDETAIIISYYFTKRSKSS